jgi:hypothetical protein
MKCVNLRGGNAKPLAYFAHYPHKGIERSGAASESLCTQVAEE